MLSDQGCNQRQCQHPLKFSAFLSTFPSCFFLAHDPAATRSDGSLPHVMGDKENILTMNNKVLLLHSKSETNKYWIPLKPLFMGLFL